MGRNLEPVRRSLSHSAHGHDNELLKMYSLDFYLERLSYEGTTMSELSARPRRDICRGFPVVLYISSTRCLVKMIHSTITHELVIRSRWSVRPYVGRRGISSWRYVSAGPSVMSPGLFISINRQALQENRRSFSVTAVLEWMPSSKFVPSAEPKNSGRRPRPREYELVGHVLVLICEPYPHAGLLLGRRPVI